MTIPAGQTSITRHVGNGTADTFDYEFNITAESDLLVTIVDSDNVEAVQTLTTDYTVAGVGDAGGGSITLVAGALDSGYVITIEDAVGASQLTPYGNQGAFFGSLHENSFDKLTRLVKRLLDLIGISMRLPTHVSGVSTLLPIPEALKLLRWDSGATGLENVSAADIGTTLATSNWIVDRFVDGVDFTAGATTTLTLSANPAVIQNTWIFFDGVALEQDDYSIAGAVVTFDVAIPGGTTVVEVRQNEALTVNSADASAVYYTYPGGGGVQTTVQERLKREVWIEDFGADPLGAADSYPAFALAKARGLQIKAGPGTFLLSQPIGFDSDESGGSLTGAGPYLTVFKATHSIGPVVYGSRYQQQFTNATLDASPARQSGAIGDNVGIRLRPDDTAGHHAQECLMDQLRIINQPSHGIVLASSVFGLKIGEVWVEDCAGCGFYEDNGTMYEYTNNVTRPGAVNWISGHILDCGGHAVKIGDDDGSVNIPLRQNIVNIDTYRNAQGAATGSGTVTTPDAGGTTLIDSAGAFEDEAAPGMYVHNVTDGSVARILSVDSGTQITCVQLSGGTDNQWDSSDTYQILFRRNDYAWWIYAESSYFLGNGIGCKDSGGSPAINALWIAGRDCVAALTRFIAPVGPSAAHIGNITADSITTRGVEILDFMVSDTTSNLDPAVTVDPAVVKYRVKANRVTDMDSVATPTAHGEWDYERERFVHMDVNTSNLKSGRVRELDDDVHTTIEFSADTFGIGVISGNANTRGACMFKFRVGSSGYCSSLGDDGNCAFGTGALTDGTSDGTDTKLNVNAHTDNKLYIKNRTASLGNYTIAFMVLNGGHLLPAEMEKTA